VISEVKSSQVKGREGNLKWGVDQLNVVKWRELRRGGMWSVYKGSEVEWGAGLSELCNWVLYCTVRFGLLTVWCTEWFVILIHLLLNSIRVWVTIAYILCCIVFIVLCCVVLCCVVLYIILCCVVLCLHCIYLLCCTVLRCIVLYCIYCAYCVVLYLLRCIVLCSVVLCCTALNCLVV
jgi:hypothetical protein